MGLSFCGWNVKGMGQLVKKKKVLSTLKSKKYDLVFLQETHFSELENKELHRHWVRQIFYYV